MQRLYILGGSGIGMIAASIVDGMADVAVEGFVNDVVPVGTEIGKFRAFPVIATTDELPNLLSGPDAVVFNGFVGMTKQEEAYRRFKSLDVAEDKFINVLAPSTILPQGYCSIGRGILCAPYAQLSPDTEIGNHCRILGNAFVGHDTVLDECVSLATNSVVGANVHVERGVHVGSNATIREKVTLGEFSLVGMGAVVVRDVPPRSIVVGNPAKVLRSA